MLVACLRLVSHLRLERAALSKKRAQYRIDIALGWPALDESTSLYRLVHGRMLTVATRLESIERTPQQRFDQRVGRTSPRKARDDRLHASVPAQGAVGQIDQRRSRRECGRLEAIHFIG